MSIDKKTVERIAHLARIELDDIEKDKLGKDLSAILKFVGKLNEVDTKNVEPMTGGTALENVLRDDKQIDKDLQGKSAELIGAAPEKKDGWVKVKAVFE